MEQQRQGNIVLFSSIAAVAPRQRNAVYSAAKAALETYGRAIRHHLADTEVRVQVYALGYVDEPLLSPLTGRIGLG